VVLRQPACAHAISSGRPESGKDVKRYLKVLVVDDDVSVRESMSRVLQDAGYEVRIAADGAEALAQFETDDIDLLLLDLGLPLESGWDIFERITRENPFLPIIIITGQPDQHDVAVAAGVGALMEKPLDVSELLRTIQELLAEPREVRLRRLGGQGGRLRHVAASNAEFLRHLREQYEKPYRFKLPPQHKFF
jgi:DNA-binding response OmpR family regulator